MQEEELCCTLSRQCVSDICSTCETHAHVPFRDSCSDKGEQVREFLSYINALTDLAAFRVLQSQNQSLQDVVKRMTTRIRDLEAALSSTSSQLTAQPHPLLQESAANRENEALIRLLEGGSLNGASPEEVQDAFGSLSIGEQGQAC